MAAVLFAARLHAFWTSLVKRGSDRFGGAALVCLWCGVIALAVAATLPAPAVAAWPFIGASAATHVLYFALVGRLYHSADLSAAYPIMRGTAPLLATIGAWLLLGERLGLAPAAGVALLVGGVFWMAVDCVKHGGVDSGAQIAPRAKYPVIAGY